MASATPVEALTSSRVHQQQNLKDAVSLAMEQDTDMIIVSKDKQRLPCHSSLLSFYSPVVARLLAGLPCCTSPTIFLPDFLAVHIRKLLHLLRCGQAITGEDVIGDIGMVIKSGQVLKIPMTDLNVGPYHDNPYGVPFQVKQELNVKREINSEEKREDLSMEVEADNFNEKLEAISVKQEEMEQPEYIEQDVTEKILKQENMSHHTPSPEMRRPCTLPIPNPRICPSQTPPKPSPRTRPSQTPSPKKRKPCTSPTPNLRICPSRSRSPKRRRLRTPLIQSPGFRPSQTPSPRICGQQTPQSVFSGPRTPSHEF